MGKETGIKRSSTTEADHELANEFRTNPLGPYSPGLQRLLNWFHAEELNQKYCLVCRKPHREWVLGMMQGRAKPVKIFEDRVFTSLPDGEWEIFKLRWRRYFGETLE